MLLLFEVLRKLKNCQRTRLVEEAHSHNRFGLRLNQTPPNRQRTGTNPLTTMSGDDEKMNNNLNSNEKKEEEEEEEKESLLANSKSLSATLSRSPSPEPESDESTDPRFSQPPPPSRIKRTSLLIFLAFLFWLAYSMLTTVLNAKKKAKIVYASRWVAFSETPFSAPSSSKQKRKKDIPRITSSALQQVL